MNLYMLNKIFGVGVAAVVMLSGCAQPNRMGMIKDPDTGIQYGSMVGNTFFMDADQFPNKTIKVSARNASGDVHYDIRRFKSELELAFQSKGFEAYKNDGFGVKVDVVVEYSGHVQSNMSGILGVLGSGAGYVVGRHSSGTASEGIGIVAGATLGAIAGSYITDDTYIIVATVNVGVMDEKTGKTSKTITFSRSPKLQEEEDDGFKRFKEVVSTKVAVYAGGRNLPQSEVVGEVRRRLVRIVSDII